MKRSERNPGTMAQEAAEWTERLKRVDARELASFDQWLTDSPRHVREFLLMSTVDRALDSVDTVGKHDVQALLAQAKHDGVISLNSYRCPAPRRTWSQGRWTWLAAAAVVAVLVAVGWWKIELLLWKDFSTTVGEQKTLQLADGSVVSLNTQSRLQVRFGKQTRELRLLRGQALFKVAADATRPFRVEAGEAVIQAIGTQFDVYKHADTTVTVAVVEGRVKVFGQDPRSSHVDAKRSERQILSAGEEAKIATDGTIGERALVSKGGAPAWQQRRLVFRRDSLETVIEEFNRYNQRLRFRLDKAARPGGHYSGEFNADDPESLLMLLSADPNLAVIRDGGEVVVRERSRTQ